jgi:hypothetical protein
MELLQDVDVSNLRKNPAEDLVPLGMMALYRDEPIVRVAFELACTMGECREEALMRVIDALHQALLTRSRGEAPEQRSRSSAPAGDPEHGASTPWGRLGAVRDVQALIGVISARAEFALAHAAPADPIREELARVSRASSQAAAVAAQLLRDDTGATLGGAVPGPLEQYSGPLSASGGHVVPPLGILRSEEGSIVVGWAGEGVLLAAFQGHLSAELGEAYADRLQTLLSGRIAAQYFIDSSRLDSFELAARTAAVRALVAAAPRLSSVLVLKWSGGESPTGKAMLRDLASVLRTTDDRAEFERALCAALGSESAGAQVTSPVVDREGDVDGSEVFTTP